METSILSLILIPLFSSLLLGAFSFVGSKKIEKWAGWIASLALLVSFGFACILLGSFLENPTGPAIILDLGSWMHVGTLQLDAVFQVDQLSAVLISLVTGVGLLVHVYSIGYMSHDENQTRYFAYLNLFCVFMLLLLTGSSLPLIFIGWEGVGLCSFLLIGFWFEEKSNVFAGRKAFVVNRIGDAGLLIAMFLLFKTFGTLNIDAIAKHPTLAELSGSMLPEAIMIFIFIGAVGKSAQFPLYIWLPDAMAGPTPVSALIHAATMVTAGVYLLCRMFFLLEMAPVAMDIIAYIGAFTALFAATIAVVQTDIKKVLAYSTISQLGFMVLAVGSGNPDAGMYHLITHAYFKALLFLAAGSVIHALHGEQNILKMGGLKTHLVPTTITFIFGYLAIIGFPGFSGWATKDAILHGVLAHGHTTLFLIGLVSAMLTAGYMTRLYYLVFLDNPRSSVQSQRDIHDSPSVMIIPMGILALLSFLGVFAWARFETVLSPIFHVEHVEGSVNEIKLAVLVSIASLVSAGSVYFMYRSKRKTLEAMATMFEKMNEFIRREYGINEFLVKGSTAVSKVISEVLALFDRFVVDGAVHAFASATTSFSKTVSRFQTGEIQTYSYVLVLGCVVLILYLLKGAA